MRSILSTVLLAFAPSVALAETGYSGLAIAPRGDRVASVETAEGQRGRIVERAVADGKVVRTIDSCATCTYAGLAFGPQGTLAYLQRDRAAGTVTLLVDDGARQKPVATVAGLASTPRFSADGGRIALMVTLGATKETGATQAGARQVGEIGETNDAQRIAVFDLSRPAVAAAAVTPVSPADRYVYEYDWTPDGTGFVATTATGNGDANWWVATLDAIDAGTGAVRSIARPTTQLNAPRVSPDGRTVAYIGGLMSDFGSVGGDIWTVPFAGGTPTNITPVAPMSFLSLAWTRGGMRAVALRGDQIQIMAVAPNKAFLVGYSQPTSLAAGDGRAVFAPDGTAVATVAQDFTHAPAIYAGRSVTPVQITHDNDGLTAPVAARSITWKNDGFNVQGWLLSPIGTAAGGKAPMIVEVHGGPSSASTPSFVRTGLNADLVDAGYHVFLPNPRGSYGQGEAFTAANRRDFGGGDLRDILAGIDAAEKVAPIDDARLGLAGCSYGGFMAMWANTQTDRFKAIVAGAGLSNWVSYYGTNGIDTWMTPFFGETAYEDVKAYEDVSAVYHVKTARTPTFIYVGERDIEVPPTQSIEWWRALRSRNVPTSLVVYPDAGHCVTAPAQAADVRKRALAWFDRYLKAN